jgi:PhnB protein
MSHPYKPPGHTSVSPYLLVSDVKSLLAFLAQVFDAKELSRWELPDGTLKHAEVRIDDSVIMMGERPATQSGMTGSVHVYVADVDATYTKALAAGATSLVEPRDQAYGDRSAGIRDTEGNYWWIGTRLRRS